MTTLLHIIGGPGVGKSNLAHLIIAGCEPRRKGAALDELTATTKSEAEYDAVHDTYSAFLTQRHEVPGLLFELDGQRYDFLAIEHQSRPANLMLQKGDAVITMELQS